MNFPIKMFYHFFISPDDRGLFWNWWLDDQISRMIKSNLHTNIPVSICITMPEYWNKIYEIPIYKNNSDEQILFRDKVIEYINLRYPFISIEDIRDTGLPNIYEGSTLLKLWEYSKNNPGQYVAYIHNKGVLSLSAHTKCWREVLDYYFITDWQNRYRDLLFGNDVIAMLDKQCDETIVSGNYFWASTDYISTLELPLYEDRYQYEKWILSGNPKLSVVNNTNVDHFKTYFFEENI